MGRLYNPDGQTQTTSTPGGRLYRDPTISGGIASSVKAFQESNLAYDKQLQEQANPTKAVYRGPASEGVLEKDATLKEWDSLDSKKRNLFVASLKDNIKKGDQDASVIVGWLDASGKLDKSLKEDLVDFYTASNDKLVGGLSRGFYRGLDFAIPGKDNLGLSSKADELDQKARESAQYGIGGEVGRVVGTGAKAIVDVGTLAVPVGKVDKVVEGANLAAKFGGRLGKAGEIAGWTATKVPGSLVGTGIGVAQDIGRGDDPQIAKNVGIGLATDILLPGALKGLKAGDQLAGRAVSNLAESGGRPAMTELRNEGVVGTLDKVVSKAIKGAGYKFGDALAGTSAGSKLVGIKDSFVNKMVDNLAPVYRTLKRGDFINDTSGYGQARSVIGDAQRSTSFAQDYLSNNEASQRLWTAVRAVDNDVDAATKVVDDYVAAKQELDLSAIGKRKLSDEQVARYEKQLADNIAGEGAYRALVDNYTELNQIRLENGLISKEIAEEWAANPIAYAKKTAALDAELQAGKITEDVYKQLSDTPIGEEQDKLIAKLIDDGKISDNVANNLSESAGYVRQQKEMSDYRVKKMRGQSGPVASVSSTIAAQRRNAKDTKEIASSLTTLVQTVQSTYRETTRNNAAKTISSLLEQMGEAKRLAKAPGPNVPHISFIENGKKVHIKVPAEIELAIRGFDTQTSNVLIDALRPINNVFRAGTTGFNPAFAVTNPIRDLVSGAVVSKNARKSYNPINLVNSIFATLGKPLNQNDTAIFRSFEKSNKGAYSINQYVKKKESETLMRQQALTGSSQKQKWSNYAVHPSKAMRALADGFNSFVGKSEQVVRFAGFKGTYEQAIKQGATLDEATQIASRAARENTVDFMAAGSWGKVLNSVFPYSNAGVQGSRTLFRSIAERPVSTTAKIITLVGMPVATTTIWNNMDEDRRNIYNTIPEYVKESNFVIIKPGAKWDEKNRRWDGVVLIPKPPGLSDTVEPTRRYIEYVFDTDPEKSQTLAGFLTGDVGKTANNIAGTLSPIDFSDPNKFLSSVTPQALKPTTEAILGKDFFTGRDLIPNNMQDLPADRQKFEEYSQLTSYIGNLFNTSPLRVDKWIKGTFGEVGSNAVNLVDRGLLATGVAPGPEAVGGRSMPESVQRRFVSPGGADETAFYKVYNSARALRNQASADATKLIKEGKPNEAKMLMERFNKSLPELYKPFQGKYKQSPTYKNEWDQLIQDLELSTKESAIKRRKDQ